MDRHTSSGHRPGHEVTGWMSYTTTGQGCDPGLPNSNSAAKEYCTATTGTTSRYYTTTTSSGSMVTTTTKILT